MIVIFALTILSAKYIVLSTDRLRAQIASGSTTAMMITRLQNEIVVRASYKQNVVISELGRRQDGDSKNLIHKGMYP